MIYYVNNDTNKAKEIFNVNIEDLENKWKNQNMTGNNGIGYVFDYDIYSNVGVLLGKVNIFCPPEFINELDEAKKIFVSVIWKQNEILTDGKFHSVLFDASKIIKGYYDDLYRKSRNKPAYFLMVWYCEVDGEDVYKTHGDFPIEWQ